MSFGGGPTNSPRDPLGGRSDPSIAHGPGGPAEEKPSRAPLRAVAFVLVGILVAVALYVAASFLYRLAADAREESHSFLGDQTAAAETHGGDDSDRPSSTWWMTATPDSTQLQVDQFR